MLLALGTAQAGMYRWVDGGGRVHYGDTAPATFEQSGGVEMNKQGQVVKRTRSEAERRVDAGRQAEQAQALQAQQRQAQLDRALISTYADEAEIDLARDRALENIKLVIAGAETRARVVDADLAELKQRVAQLEKSGHPVGHALQDQVERTGSESDELKRTIQKNQEAMVRMREKYAADKVRFREITGK